MKTYLNFDNLLSKTAKKAYHLHSYSTEWKTAIGITFAAKLVTMAVSVYAGYYFLLDTLQTVVPDLLHAVLLSVLILAILEITNGIFLSKFFKFLLRFKTHYLTAIALLITVICVYTLSFHISTSGLAAKQSKQVDKTVIYISQRTNETQSIKLKYKELRTDLNEQIKLITLNPEWRTGLSSKQQIRISKYNNKKIDLIDSEANELLKLENKYNKMKH